MRFLRLAVVLVISALLVVPALPAGAQSNNQYSRPVQVQGVVVSVHPSGNGFVLHRARQSGTWTVVMTDDTEVQLTDALAKADDNIDDPEVAVGDWVTIVGQRNGTRQLVATHITIYGHGQAIAPAPYPTPTPYPVRPSLPAPQLFIPSSRERVTESQVLVLGRTVPGARVHIDLYAEANRSSATRTDVQADANGIFSAKLELPGQGYRGATYRVVVTSSINGQVSVPTSTPFQVN